MVLKKSVEASGEKVKSNSSVEGGANKALVDNFIALQKVMTELSYKFDSLTEHISKLLQLFEISAKSLAKKEFESVKEETETKKIMEKLENISQQANLIGKGLALIHETNKENKQNDFSIKNEHPLKTGAMPSIMSMRKENRQNDFVLSQPKKESAQNTG